MASTTAARYILASGTQVREEDFGLLFYTMAGPRLYFLSSGKALDPEFFEGQVTLDQWLSRRKIQDSVSKARILKIENNLNQLKEKGVILER